jgi:hypothetical protein
MEMLNAHLRSLEPIPCLNRGVRTVNMTVGIACLNLRRICCWLLKNKMICRRLILPTLHTLNISALSLFNLKSAKSRVRAEPVSPG